MTHTKSKSLGAIRWWIATALSIAVIATFFLFFKDANAAFSERTIDADALPAALATWGQWQWGRVLLGTAAFVTAIRTLRAPH